MAFSNAHWKSNARDCLETLVWKGLGRPPGMQAVVKGQGYPDQIRPAPKQGNITGTWTLNTMHQTSAIHFSIFFLSLFSQFMKEMISFQAGASVLCPLPLSHTRSRMNCTHAVIVFSILQGGPTLPFLVQSQRNYFCGKTSRTAFSRWFDQNKSPQRLSLNYCPCMEWQINLVWTRAWTGTLYPLSSVHDAPPGDSRLWELKRFGSAWCLSWWTINWYMDLHYQWRIEINVYKPARRRASRTEVQGASPHGLFQIRVLSFLWMNSDS